MMLKKKNYMGSAEEIDMLFKVGENEPDQVYNDVMAKLKDIKNRNLTQKLVSQLQRMEVIGPKDKVESESKQLQKGLTTMFGAESKSKRTIKEKLSKGLYTLSKTGGKDVEKSMF